MSSLRARLPPLNALVAFEASARLLSFTRAGEELRVSREAVSRQIRNLENHLGVKLFRRVHRALELTPAGAEFEGAVREALGAVAKSADTLRRRAGPSRVTVTATIAIATFWLTPRLPRFRSEHPEVEIRVVVSDGPVDMAAGVVDVGLWYGDGKWPGVTARRLYEVDSFPVCAPGYPEQAPAITSPFSLVAHTLLNLDGAPHAQEDWHWWLEGAGVDAPPGALHILGFDSYANVIQAAVDGQGVALGFGGIIDGLLERGQLVRPLDVRLSKGLAVYRVSPKGGRPTAVARKFQDWLLAEVEAQKKDAGAEG